MKNLPQKLNRITSSLLGDSYVTNFNVYIGDESKLVIYFESEMDNPRENETQHFKLKSKKQVARDNERAANHNVRSITNIENGNFNSEMDKNDNSVLDCLVAKECFRTHNESETSNLAYKDMARQVEPDTPDCNSGSTLDSKANMSTCDSLLDIQITPPTFPIQDKNQHSTHSKSLVNKDSLQPR